MLRDGQNGFADALRIGPDALPAELFSGPPQRNLLAMAAHANTISHGRLVAMEDIFPTYRGIVGDAQFNARSRRYVEQGFGLYGGLDAIGDVFPDWLADDGEATDLIAIARFDLAYLTAYHCADTPVLTMALLPSDSAELLKTMLSRHPAASIHPANSALLTAIGHPDWAGAAAVLMARTDMSVTYSPAPPLVALAWDRLAHPLTFAALCAMFSQDHDDSTIVPAIIALIASGALQKG